MKLKSSLLFSLALLVSLSAAGCNMFRKTKKPKENPAIAAEVEADFRQRWIDRRTTELTSKGTDATAATEQASREFHEKYPYVVEHKKK
jgi:hypothetical protein